MEWCQLAALGVLGGVLAEFVAVSAHRKQNRKDWPEYLSSPSYWAIGLGWVALGGLVAALTLDSVENVHALLPIQAGATAPLFIERLLANAPPGPPGTIEA